MATINLYTEKGTVSVKVRNGLKSQMVGKVQEVLGDNLDYPVLETARNTIAVQIGETENGEALYAEVAVTITTKDPSEKKTRKAKAKATPVVEEDLPQLFSEDAPAADLSGLE